VGNISVSASELQAQAEELQQLIGQFRIERQHVRRTNPQIRPSQQKRLHT
jgi:hypothetical protein